MAKKYKKIMAITLVLIVVAFLVWASFLNKDNKQGMTGQVVYESSEDYSGLYKEPVSFTGYHYCNFVFDYELEDYAKEQEWIFKKFCNLSENYPVIKDFLYDEYFVDVESSDEWQFSAWYYGGGNIIINNKFKRAKNLDIYIAHEIAHSSTENLNLPTWLDEGIAQYSGYRFFGTQTKLTRFWFQGIEKWNPNTASVGENIKGYTHSGYIIRYFVEEYGDNFISDLLKELYGKINYEDDIDTKNQKVLSAFRKVTNNENLSLDDILRKYP